MVVIMIGRKRTRQASTLMRRPGPSDSSRTGNTPTGNCTHDQRTQQAVSRCHHFTA